MAGGMNRRGGGIPLAARVRPSSTASRFTEPFPGPPSEDCPARHCWVADAADRAGVKRPGLLLEWRRTRGGWEGRVVYAAHLRPDAWALVEEWLPSSLLTPG
ncbi:hypothetical protein [Nocardioides ferulae]|uniref:hypothetical protein n=1 Tax=Nocardioides ferulae TaxID=2340821 RepID=UPI000EAD93D8|nr:hypothetical protein [Nocardioides ferulae]